jgi:hypothetical protein
VQSQLTRQADYIEVIEENRGEVVGWGAISSFGFCLIEKFSNDE